MKRVVAVAIVLAACAHTARIMTWTEYGKRSVSWPYIFRRGTLLYYGASHTYKPDDPQIAEIQKLWSEFHPDIVLNEGGNPPVAATIEEAVTQYGEAGLIRFLARRDDVPVVSIDPVRSEETAYLSKRFTREQIKMFHLVKAVAQQMQNHDPAKVDAELTRILSIDNDTPGLSGSPRTADEFIQIYRQYFPDAADYKAAKMSWFDPMKNETLFNAMARLSSEYRDRYMVAMLQRHLRDGERVFAVVGGTHVVMQEPALNP
ncbi:MAG: hypothetical protein M3041_04205 [Acidobacteriota bacterium]|nr:hypothetical protein [Acidobacteriota bacterium]